MNYIVKWTFTESITLHKCYPLACCQLMESCIATTNRHRLSLGRNSYLYVYLTKQTKQKYSKNWQVCLLVKFNMQKNGKQTKLKQKKETLFYVKEHEQKHFYKTEKKERMMKHFLDKANDLFIYFFTSSKNVLIKNLIECVPIEGCFMYTCF